MVVCILTRIKTSTSSTSSLSAPNEQRKRHSSCRPPAQLLRQIERENRTECPHPSPSAPFTAAEEFKLHTAQRLSKNEAKTNCKKKLPAGVVARGRGSPAAGVQGIAGFDHARVRCLLRRISFDAKHFGQEPCVRLDRPQVSWGWRRAWIGFWYTAAGCVLFFFGSRKSKCFAGHVDVSLPN